MLISIFVKSAASKNHVGGTYDGRLIVCVTAAAVDGAANRAVISVLAKALEIPKNELRVKSGLTARRKIIEIMDETIVNQLRISQLRNEH